MSAIQTNSPFALGVEERAPLSLTVSKRLRDAIVSGKVAVGTAMPAEKDLARELGVGRSTVREALRILQAQGLLTGGDTVSTQRPRVSAELMMSTAAFTMENVLRLGQVPLQDLVELRLVIEGAAVEGAARASEAEALAEAQEAVTAMKAPRIDIVTFRAADLRFHRALAAASGNIAFGLMMGVLRDAISGHLGEALERMPDPKATMRALTREHQAILDAVKKKRPQAARILVADHIRSFYARRQTRGGP